MDSVQHVHGGNLRAAAQRFGLDSNKFVDFSANINPLGPSPKAIEKIIEKLDRIIHYPDPDCLEIRGILARHVNLPLENIVMGNGAVELIYILMHVLKPMQVLLPVPTFGEYEIAVRAAGGKVKSLPLKKEENFAIDEKILMENMQDVQGIFICNPNNPTGQMITRNRLEAIIKRAAQDGKWVIIDEAFMDFVKNNHQFSVIDLVREYDNLFVVYSLTKFHALPGLRLGAGFGSKELIEKINRSKDPWNVNYLAQVAGIASLNDKVYMQKTIDLIDQEKRYLYEKLVQLPGLKPFKPSVNYIFIDIGDTGLLSGQLAEAMGKIGVLIRDCSSYPGLGEKYIRVAVKSREENDRLLDCLQRFC